MKIQNLAVIFIIIMLPISMVLTAYVQNQVQTLELQISYDTKLTNATYDALKAFQLNTVNSGSSALANSKIRDIQASVNTFFNSIAKNFNMAGYNKDILQEYVPAIVYTMYDGYYIYTPFTNTLTEDDYVPPDANGEGGSTYQNGEKIYDLKPYVHYSCRYIDGSTDVVITYSLDNCITVEGIVKGDAVYKTGYLLDNISSVTDDSAVYRGSTISVEHNLTEYLRAYREDGDGNYTEINGNYICDKVNGSKYYLGEDGKWFSILTNTVYPTSNTYSVDNRSAVDFYKNAYEFTDWVRTNLGDITTGDAVDEDGQQLGNVFGDNLPIFENQAGWADSIEDPNSLFNQHRLAVIRYSIEKNLSIAIANYNNYSSAGTSFQMPELKEDEWEKILNNVSIISFMQGLSIGGKIYNGYSIVTNTKTKEVVNLDSIYITTDDNQFHRVTDSDLLNGSNITGAYFNIDFERKSATNGTNTVYYYPHQESGCYSSIVTQSGTNSTDNIYEYIENCGNNTLKSMYFTALGRERYSMFRSNPISTDWN